MFSKRVQNILILILFLLSTSFWILQHYQFYSWDFSAYLMNAKYLVGEGNYYEHYRPPLAPFLMLIFSPFGWKSAEYIYIIFVSLLFLYSSTKLAKSLKFNSMIFYALSLNPFVLLYGMSVGTELLSIALLELFIVSLIKNNYSGFWGGVASLSRYQLILFSPLVLFYKGWKKKIINLILFGVPIFVWLIFDKIISGHPLTSISDGYALNIKYRDYIHQSIDINHLMNFVNILLPLFILGVVFVIYRLIKQYKISINYNNIKSKENKSYKKSTIIKLYNLLYQILQNNKIHLIFLFTIIITFYTYATTPMKFDRYLFSGMIGVVYFSYLGFDWVNRKSIRKMLLFLIILTAVVIPIYLTYSGNGDNIEKYKSVAEKINTLNLSQCNIMSNGWVPLNYLGIKSLPSPREQLVNYSIEKGEVIVLFKNIWEPEYVHNSSFISKFNTILEDDSVVIIGNDNCSGKNTNKNNRLDTTYTEKLNEITVLLYNESTETNPCSILFENNYIKKGCDFFS